MPRIPSPPSVHAAIPMAPLRGTAACVLLAAASVALLMALPAAAHDAHAGHAMAVAAQGEHAGHQMAGGLVRSEHAYALPALKVTRADGKQMTLSEAMDDGRPVMLNFVYTSCTSICPITSQVFVEVRERLGAQRDAVNMVSISIDPEQDTPRRLTEYAKRFGGAGTWAHYTSSSADAVEIQRAFDAWRGDKMNHQPTTYLRAAPGKPWVRLDGFYGPDALVSEFRKLAGNPVSSRCSTPTQGSATSSATAGAQAGTTTRCES
ncbi:MAG: SCO family protein [Aquincola sp.]|nr:SCO family protein [Aquincola sp.]